MSNFFQKSRVKVLGLTALSWGGLLGCDLETGLRDARDELFAPGVGYIEAPGHQVASGEFKHFQVQRPTLASRHVVTLNEDSELQLFSLEERSRAGCSVGSAQAFGEPSGGASYTGDGPEPEALLPFLVDQNSAGFGTLRFTNYDCNLKDLTVADVRLPERTLATADGPRHLLVSEDGALLSVDPWQETIEQIGQNVDELIVEGDHIWSIEDGEVVVRDRGFEELARMGRDVTALMVAENQEVPWGLYVDGGTLHQVAKGFVSLELAGDACGVHRLGPANEKIIGYYSPCGSRRLIVSDLARISHGEYAEDIIAAKNLTRTPEGFDFFYWKGAADSTSAQLYHQEPTGEPVLIADSSLVDTRDILADARLALVNWNGMAGNAIALTSGTPQVLAEGVAEQNDLGLLTDYDGATGSLYRLESQGDELREPLEALTPALTRKLGESVPRSGTRGKAFVAGSDGQLGDLMLVQGEQPEKIAGNVSPDGFRFSRYVADLLVYVSDHDPAVDGGTLRVQLTNTGDDFMVSQGVRGFVEVSLPKPGLLYQVGQGERQGLWFASVR